MSKKIFVTGIGGLTGYKICHQAKGKYDLSGSYNHRNPNLDFVNSLKLNLREHNKVRSILEEIMPDILINTVAISNVDYCETHQEEAQKTNVNAVENLSEISKELGIKLIHLSSDSVFDGTKNEPYVETDKPKPINFYGITKLRSEKIVLLNSKNLIVRVSVLYGWLPKILSEQSSSSMKSTNFGQWLITKLISNEKIRIVTDELSSPIIAEDLANSILELINNNCSGIFHCAPMIRINRYEFCKKLADYLNLNYKLIQPITTKELGRSVPTGFNKCLDSTKISNIVNFNFLSLEQSCKILKKQLTS